MKQDQLFRPESLKQATQSLFSYALFRPESAIVIALSISGAGATALGVSFVPGTWWMWLGLGLIGEVGIVWTTLRDDQLRHRILDEMFRQQFDLKSIVLPELRQKLVKALEYRDLLVREIGRKDNGTLDAHLFDVTRSMEDWIAQIYRLAQATDVYARDPVIARDLLSVPKELERFAAQRNQAQSKLVLDELDKTIAIKRQQWESLQRLRDAMAQAQLQLDHTLAAMGTVYMQAKLLGSNEANSGRAQRLQADMLEQVHQLEDTHAAMEELRNFEFRMKN
ncbi:MAG: hypothetical protein KGS46_02135 [Chloroflexi bacterium]|nr:hypothetical protein [Chloroflexota bacterium]